MAATETGHAPASLKLHGEVRNAVRSEDWWAVIQDGSMFFDLITPPAYGKERTEALARLIAAAPDMLSELRAHRLAVDQLAAEAVRLRTALRCLVIRCDGDEGVRADGSNIDTLAAHAALGDLDEEESRG